MTDKRLGIKYAESGTELITEGLTNDEQQAAKELFNDGERDPSVIRDNIGL